jgi:hypothetical protein
MRPKITSIAVTMEHNGKTKTVHVDPAKNTALFWGDHAVDNILTPFYHNNPRKLTHDEQKANLHVHAEAARNGIVDGEVIQQIWHGEHKSGQQPAFIAKTGVCPPCPSEPM